MSGWATGSSPQVLTVSTGFSRSPDVGGLTSLCLISQKRPMDFIIFCRLTAVYFFFTALNFDLQEMAANIKRLNQS